MQQVHMPALYNWFTEYVRSFYHDDEDIQFHIRQKEDHTARVTVYSRQLAAHLGLSENEQRLAEAIGLFHDVGRFKQYTLYRTFDDRASVNHAELGLQELAGCSELKQMSSEARHCFEYAILSHNVIRIAEPATEEQRQQAHIIRDADKLDIFYVLAPYLQPPCPEGYTPSFVDDLLQGRQSSFTDIKTADDRKLVRLNWVYDINFAWTLRQIKEKGYVEQIISYLPQDAAIDTVKRHLLAYMTRKSAE